MSLQLVLQVLRQRIMILVWAFLATIVGAVALLLLVPPRYDAVATASMDPSVSDPVSGQGVGMMLTYIQGNLMALAKSEQVALAVVKRLRLDESPQSQAEYRSSSVSALLTIEQWLASQLAEHVDPKFTGASNVITITYKGNGPQEAATLANAFMAAFIDAAIAQKNAAAQKAADWYTPQIDRIRSELTAAREQLNHFQVASKLLAPTGTDAENDQLVAVSSELSRAKAELVALQTQLAAPALTAAGSNEAQSLDLQTLGSLRSNLSAIDAEIARMQTLVGGNNPHLVEKIATRQSLLRQIDIEVAEYRKKLSDRISSQTQKIAQLEEAYKARQSSMIDIQGQRDQLGILSRQVLFHQDELDRLQKAAVMARLQSQLSFSNIAILDAATPPTSVSFPKKTIILALAVGLGLILGVMLALLSETIDRRLRAVGDLQYITDAPLLGAMPDYLPKKKARFLPRLGQRPRLGGPKPPAIIPG